MTPDDWAALKHFKITENWGDPALMDRDLLFELDAFRDFVATDIFVSCGTNKTHEVNSQHGLGLAVDVMFPQCKQSDLFDIYMDASRFKFTGIGVYPNWQYEGSQIGGLHLDFRSSKFRALWMGVEDSGVQKYIELSLANLKQYGLILGG